MTSPGPMLGLRLIEDTKDDFSIFARRTGLLDVAGLGTIRSVPLCVISVCRINH